MYLNGVNMNKLHLNAIPYILVLILSLFLPKYCGIKEIGISSVLNSFNWSPTPERGQQYIRYLAPSVKVTARADGYLSSGSGTIIAYDPIQNEAYVISCGHIWNESKTYTELQKIPLHAEITTWYHNETKLTAPKVYNAKVLFCNRTRGYDISLLKFKPDWKPDFISVAAMNTHLSTGIKLHSIGCDHGTEVAHYYVEFVELRNLDLITKYNSPRSGRSGGGLVSDEGLLVGVCWGTSELSGDGTGFFTSLPGIYRVFKDNGFQWILQHIPKRIIYDVLPFDSDYIIKPEWFT